MNAPAVDPIIRERPPIEPLRLLRPRRRITGMSAVLLPYRDDGGIDWAGFQAHVQRTVEAGLVPAVNMDTGYGPLLDGATRAEVIAIAQRVARFAGGANIPFLAGAYIADRPGDAFNLDGYRQAAEPILERGGVPVIFQSHGLTALRGQALGDAYEQIGRSCGRFIAFELGMMFAPFGAIYDLESYRAMMRVDLCIGAKHSSLRRELEWERLELRDGLRPDFMVLTGNDLAIDMVMYGSDYLLGLSTFAPELFARRDAMWAAADRGFYELNDALQSLGSFAFRDPVPAYKHSAAQFLKLRGWIDCDAVHPFCPRRPQSDVEILRAIADRLERC